MSLATDLACEALMSTEVDVDLPDLAELIHRPAWMYEAACRGKTDLFFVGQGGDTAPAKALCAACCVWEPCLAYAVEGRERFGIWAGTAPLERRNRRLTA